MAEAANIKTIEALREFKQALFRFEEQVQLALTSARSDVQRGVSRLKNDIYSHWKREEQRWSRKLAESKNELSRAQLQASDLRPSLILERKAVHAAEQKLEQAQRKLERVRYWTTAIEKEHMLCLGSCQQISRTIEDDLPRLLAKVDQMLENIESYVRLSAPQTSAGPDSREIPAAAHGRESVGAGTAPAGQNMPEASRRQKVPAISPEEFAQTFTPGEAPGTIPIDAAMLDELDAVDVERRTPDAADRIIVDLRLRDADSMVLHRMRDAAEGDSGWFISPAGAPRDHDAWRSVTSAALQEVGPKWARLLAFPPGWTIEIRHRGGLFVRDDEGREHSIGT